MLAKLENSAVATGLGKVIFIPISKKGNAEECSNYHTIILIAHASKAMLKILQARLQQYMNRELPDVQAGFKKGRGTRDQIANIHWITEKARKQVQFSSVAQSCRTLCDPMNRSTPGLPVHHHLLEITQTHVHRVCDAIQPSHPGLSPSQMKL